ncbi:hypothetical protein C8R43DRAFT_1131319 [Mycena crocata]|nr:hypothetical protein C8R43DRAFT_1131319 [Mycena crocata]
MKTETALDQLRRGYLPTPVELERIQTDLASLSTELARLDAQIRDFMARRDNMMLFKRFFGVSSDTPECSDESTRGASPPMPDNQYMESTRSLLKKEHVQSPNGLDDPLGIRFPCRSQAFVADIWANPKFDENQILMTTLSESTSRWREITLTMLPIEYIHEFYCASAPLLQDLRITESRLPAKDWRDLFTLPSVRTLSLQGLNHLHCGIPREKGEQAPPIINKHAPDLLDAFSNITHLSFPATLDDRGVCQSVQGISGKLFVGILKNLPELVSLEAYINDLELRATKVTKLAALTSLFLHARFIDLPVVDHFLDSLVMPKLRNLRVAANPSALPFLPFSSLRKGSPLIRQLDIDSGAFSKEVFREIIRNFPSLVKLVFRDGECDRCQDPRPANTEYLLTLLSQPAIRRSLPFLKDLEI